MKKIIFAFAALLVMVCTALSFTSCGDDDDVKTMECTGYWTVAYESGQSATTESSSILAQLNARSTEVMGTSYMSAYDEKTLILTTKAVSEIVSRMNADSQINSLVEKLSNQSNVAEVYYMVYCGSKEVAQIKF